MSGKPSLQDNASKNKRIASNTLLLFVRMFILTLVNLYAVRLVLKGLGEEDFGVFNTVAGVITTTTFLSSVLAMSIQRFFSIALGKQDHQQLKEIFSASINIILILSLIVFILFETVGIWFLNTQLTIPEARMEAARCVFHLSLFAFIFSIIQIPFTAAIFAHEDMGYYALISAVECFLKLLVAILLGHFLIDNMVFYGAGLLIVSTVIMLSYILFAHTKYEECHYHTFKNPLLYKQLLSFSSWTLFGTFANMGIIQGSTILLNIFFGSIIIAAFTVSLNINNAFNALCNSTVLAFRPAMIRAYAEEQFDYLNSLFYISNKSLLYLLVAVAVPIELEMRTILNLWLGNVSEEMVLFSRLIIIYIVCMALNNPISIIMHATGHIKEYSIRVESITLLCIPLSWFLFRMGMPHYSVFFSIIGLCIIAHIVRLWCLHRYYPPFSLSNYIRSLILPAITIISVVSGASFLLNRSISSTGWRFIAVVILSLLMLTILVYSIGINKAEKATLRKLINNIHTRKR
ncbi:MAG: polysaccharide biosynthesis protein [Prevotella sp.]|nr:polysaccharide biosynthesis protein [Prevotella sp.]